MGRRGRPLNVTGVYSPKHHYTKAEKIKIAQRTESLQNLAKGSALLPPDWITKTSKAIFDDVITNYKNLGAEILCDLDMNALTMYCDALAEYLYYKDQIPKLRKSLNDVLDAEGWEDDPSEHLKNIRFATNALQTAEGNQIKQQKLFMDLSVALGLTPEARTRLASLKKAKEKEDDDPGVAWLHKIVPQANKDA